MKTISYIILFSVVLFSCSTNQKEGHTAHDHAKDQASATKYTCPMHPQVVQDGAGSCPVCGMDLVPVTKGADANSNDLMLTESQIKLANISTRRVTTQALGQTRVVNGTLVENQELSKTISTRASGRIEKLYVKETGRVVQKGEPLYEIYSESLLTLQREYLLAKEQFETLGKKEDRYKSFFDAAKRKLLLYGLTEGQVQKLTTVNNIQPRATFLAPVSGIVTEIAAAEGQYVTEGTTLLRLEDVSSLWLEAELYPNESSLVRTGDKIKFRVVGFENAPKEATVTFVSPEFRANTQIMLLRANVSNPGLLLQPGMQAQVFFTHSTRKGLAVPIDAVIREGKGSHVYLQKGVHTFRPQMVKTGLEDFETVEIMEGLNEGDTVAVTGAYLLYSELILKRGSDPMASHNH